MNDDDLLGEQPRTTRLTANGITIELDLHEVLTAIDPHGTYRGYDPDTDESVYEPSALEEHIVDACAALLVKSLRKDVKDAVIVSVRGAIDAEVAEVVRATLAGEVQQTDSWGTPRGDAVPLRDLIAAKVDDALRKPEFRDGYGAGRGKTVVQQIIEKEVATQFKTDLKAAVAEAQTQAFAAVKASAAEVITETIQRATRGL